MDDELTCHNLYLLHIFDIFIIQKSHSRDKVKEWTPKLDGIQEYYGTIWMDGWLQKELNFWKASRHKLSNSFSNGNKICKQYKQSESVFKMFTSYLLLIVHDYHINHWNWNVL